MNNFYLIHLMVIQVNQNQIQLQILVELMMNEIMLVLKNFHQ